MEHIRNTTKRLLQGLQAQQQIVGKEQIFINNLKRCLTKQEQKHIRYYSFKDARLSLVVDSSAWLYIFNSKRETLLNSINKLLSLEDKVEKILLRLDRHQKYFKRQG